MENIKEKDYSVKLSQKVKMGYGAAGFGSLMVWNVFVLYGMFFFTDIVGFKPVFASTLLAIGALWGAFADPLCGYISDNRDPKKGRRRPFIKAFAVPMGIMACLIFTNTPLEGVAEQVYFVVLVLVFYTIHSFIDIPVTSLGAEMTTDYNERASLSSMRSLFYIGSLFVGNSYLVIVLFFADTFAGGSMEKGFTYAGIVVGILIVISLMVCVRSTKGYELDIKIEKTKFSFKDNFIEPFKNKPFRYVIVMFATSMAALSVAAASCVYFYIYNLKMTEGEMSTLLLAMAIVGLIGVPVINIVSQKVSKKAAWVVVMICWLIAGCIMPILFWRDGNPNIVELSLFAISVGMGTNLIFQMIWAMIPDCVEVDEYLNGKRREGLFYGVTSFIQKIAAAAASMLVGVGLTVVDYDAMLLEQSEETLDGIMYIFCGGMGVFLIVAIIIGLLNPMSRKKHTALVKAIELKNEGKEVDESEFKSLI